MRTADQIKRKLHELSTQKQSLEAKMADEPETAGKQQAAVQIDRIDEQMLLLEWVLNEPSGKYHS
jgi:hypothetical protein